jgi:hypothetical protein
VTEVEPQAPVVEGRTEPAATPAVEEPAVAEAEDEAPAEVSHPEISNFRMWIERIIK